MTRFTYNDGGRKDAGYKGTTSDCVVRAIAIATGQPYKEVYDKINTLCKLFSNGGFKLKKTAYGNKYVPQYGTSRTGVNKKVYHTYLISHGWKWRPTMQIGQGCKTHLRPEELPPGRLIVRCSKHLVAVIDGVINDTFDCSRDGTRCVYGYYSKI